MSRWLALMFAMNDCGVLRTLFSLSAAIGPIALLSLENVVIRYLPGLKSIDGRSATRFLFTALAIRAFTVGSYEVAARLLNVDIAIRAYGQFVGVFASVSLNSLVGRSSFTTDGSGWRSFWWDSKLRDYWCRFRQQG